MGITVSVIFAAFLWLYFFTASLVPQIAKEKINFDNPNQALIQLSDRINIEKNQLEKNYNRLSNVNWCHYDKKKFKVSDIAAEMNDYQIRNANQYLIHYLMMDYFTRASMRLKENHDISGARVDIEKNKYISDYHETKDFIKRFREKNEL